MAQNWNDDVYAQTTVADTGFTRMENNFTALKSNFSGTSNPSDVVAGMLHERTGGAAGAGDGLRVRNAANTAWLKVLTGDAGQKMWVYRNDTAEGWLIDATVTDRVLALKGGSGAYNVNGGSTAGTAWSSLLAAHTHTMVHTHSHNHNWYNEINGLNAQVYNSSGAAINIPRVYTTKGAGEFGILPNGEQTENYLDDAYTNNDATAASTTTTSSAGGAEPRMAAAVGTLQYPDLS